MTKTKITPNFLAKLLECVNEAGTSKPHVRELNALGTKITYEKMWFASSFTSERYRLYGRDWEVIFECATNLGTTSVGLPYSVWVQLPGEKPGTTTSRSLISYEVANADAILRDASVLRLVGGFERLFVGNILTV